MVWSRIVTGTTPPSAGIGASTAHDYGLFSFASKDEVLEKAKTYWNPGKTQFWIDSGVPLVIDRREAYFLFDMSGKRLIDVHLNGGTYNLGHRNPEVVAAVTTAMNHFDIGNHHFPALARTALAESLIATAPPGLSKVIYGSAGGEAIDMAIKTARHATGKRKIVSIVKAYHGHTGLAVQTGDERFTQLFNSGEPADFPHVPFNDLDAMEDALRVRDVAAVIMETIPATYGFPLPDPGYLRAVKALCETYGSLYIADEVQTGLMRTGELWAMMLDTRATFDGVVRRYATDDGQAERILANPFYKNIAGALSGTQEYMAAEKLYELQHDDRFDLVVIDTPPARNALDFLDAPARLVRFLDHPLYLSLIHI